MAASMEYVPREPLNTDAPFRQDGLILANFSHGKLKETEGNEGVSLPKFRYYKHTDQADHRKKNHRILVAESNSMQYVGQNYGAHAPRHVTNCKYYVGVRNKVSGKMKVYDTQSFYLRPWFGDSKVEEEGATSKEELTYLEKNDRLTEAFGSSRKQRALESRIRSKVSATALQTVANKAVKHAQSNPQEPTTSEVESVGILPPCNQKAKSLQDVYNLNDIIPPNCLEVLKESDDTLAFMEASEDQITEWRTKGTFSDYILNHLSTLPADTEDRQQRASILVYMHYLRKMYSLKGVELRAETVPVAKNLPDVLNQHLFNNFTQLTSSVGGSKAQRYFPRKLKEKVLLHILTLALLIDGFKTDLVTLHQGLPTQMKIFRVQARALGCKIRVLSGGSKVKRRSSSSSPMDKTPDKIIAELCLPSKCKWKSQPAKMK